MIFQKKQRYLLVIIFILGLFFFWWSVNKNREKKETIIINDTEQLEIMPKKIEEVIIIPEKKLPTEILIDVPFTSQAPFGKWDAYHEEACEEASLVMLEYFLQNKKLTPALAEKEIQALIAYEIKTTKNYEDSTAEEVAKLGESYYGIKNLRVVYDFTVEDLKKYLAQKKPIIIPAAGRLLGNPNFKAPGPLYHNLVLVGYTENMIITNDPGTRNGKNYRYNIKTLYNAIHDFSGDKNKIEKGRKAMIVLE